ncbi:MAG: class I SAM-dependent methyltransferase [Acidobacteriota bacterium]|nr:class I SAM-dependent methyltransferase [Acidobacteriota bacterium]
MIAAVAWYKEWFGADYLQLYSHRDRREAAAHVDFVEGQFVAAGGELHRPGAVLDLACGAGRHTEELLQRGYPALGVDLSLTLLAQRPELPRVGADMRNLPFAAGTFDWLLNFFTSFGYFEQERENFRVLEEVVRVLRPGGRYLIDFLNSDYVREHLQPRECVEKEGRLVNIERWYDPDARRINKRIRILGPDETPKTFLESVRAYSAEEVTIGLRWAGLEVDRLFGGFQGESFQHDSERLIIVGKKPA